MRYGVIYKITNTTTGKCYIGQTTRSVYKRFNDHYKERRISKGYYFYYIDDYANQSGRSKSNILEHAQRIGVEPDTVGIQYTQESSTISD